MAKDNRSTGRGPASNHAGRPTGSYSSYGTSGYGYGANGGSAPGRRSAYGAQTTNAVSNVPAKIEKKDAKASEKNLKGKQKKLAKKARKFDETDLRCYPMTVGGWIGTFILLAIPLVNVICAIMWFFGVGNKSRSAWVRSYVVIAILVILIIAIIIGSVVGILTSKAKNVEVEIDGVSYGTLGEYGMKGTLYYVACGLVDALGPEFVSSIIGKIGGGDGEEGETISGEEGVEMVKGMLAQIILGIGEEESNPEDGATGDSDQDPFDENTGNGDLDNNNQGTDGDGTDNGAVDNGDQDGDGDTDNGAEGDTDNGAEGDSDSQTGLEE